MCRSDGDTPEKQIEQILAVTPIMRGQQSNQKHVIPPRQPQQPSQPASQPPPQQQAPQQSQPQNAHDDLIDFGQNENSHPDPPHSAAMPQQPADLRASQMQNGGQGQKDMEQMLVSTSTSKGGQGPLLDFQDDMQNSLPDQHPTLKRQDTDDQEFVDAHE